MSKPLLDIRNLHVRLATEDENNESVEILRGVNLQVAPGTVHAIMGPNGSGKSTFANALMGHPFYEVTEGEAYLDGENVLEMEPDERARKGLFLAFQYPQAIPGVRLLELIRAAVNARREAEGKEPLSVFDLMMKVTANLQKLNMDPSFVTRFVNDGFSGGEKKRAEILQLMLLQPRVALLDETDSGLDIDALRIVAEGVNSMRSPDRSFIVITHYQRLLDYIEPDYVHVMVKGRIVRSGGPELARELEAQGYDNLLAELGETLSA